MSQGGGVEARALWVAPPFNHHQQPPLGACSAGPGSEEGPGRERRCLPGSVLCGKKGRAFAEPIVWTALFVVTGSVPLFYRTSSKTFKTGFLHFPPWRWSIGNGFRPGSLTARSTCPPLLRSFQPHRLGFFL
ncbi:hypothetical protein LIER_32927 [Lithospermum erythrorhizon]|uniref:Uncharacterized protein n=1 Tax=Lithospermum erythrorhizon TaxID=34254 RepID=A0AAV3RXI2_LITER